MPIYEFDCTACGHGFERLQKLSDADPALCPACGRESVKRRLSAPSFRLAGSGWYETDFKGDKDKKRNLAGEAGSKADGGETTKPADSKPASEATPSSTAASPVATTASSST